MPAERELVRQIFEKAATGWAPTAIASWLNEQGVTTKKTGQVGGRPWTPRAVLRLLENRVYLGEIGGTQVRADEIEQRVLRWLQSPRRAQMESEAGLVFSAFEPIWRVLLPETIRSLVHQLIWEVRWNARSNRFVVMLDEIALHQYAEELRPLQDKESG